MPREWEQVYDGRYEISYSKIVEDALRAAGEVELDVRIKIF